MPDHIADPVHHPAHYTMYPVEPIEITRHLGFCLGNAVKYVLRAPWKGGAEDCDKALQYLAWERETPERCMGLGPIDRFADACGRLVVFLRDARGDMLWQDVSAMQASFVRALYLYGVNANANGRLAKDRLVQDMECAARDLRRILSLRDTIGQIYEGMSGLPGECADE